MGFGGWLKARLTPSTKGNYLGKAGKVLGPLEGVANNIIGQRLADFGLVGRGTVPAVPSSASSPVLIPGTTMSPPLWLVAVIVAAVLFVLLRRK